jgi:hypothetical protein
MILDTIKELHKQELKQAVLSGIMSERRKIKESVKKVFLQHKGSEEARKALLELAKEINIE